MVQDPKSSRPTPHCASFDAWPRIGRTRETSRHARDLVSIADVGFGVSQSLPVLVALIDAKPGQRVVIDASVARSCSASHSPPAPECFTALDAIRDGGLLVSVSAELQAEWDRHASRYFWSC